MLVNKKNDTRNHRSAATESESISFVTQVKGDNESEKEDVTCYKCQEKGHYQNTCPKKYVPPPWKKDDGTSDTAPDKVKSAHNKVTVVDEDNDESSRCSGYSDEDFAFNFCTAANVFTAASIKIQGSWLLLDSGATEHVIKSKRMVVNICKSKYGCRIYGSTGSKVAMNTATMGGVGRVIFDQDGTANVLSLAKMGKMYRIMFDSWEGNTFTFHKTNRSEMKFGQHHCGIYYHDTATRYKYQSGNAIQHTIKKSVAFITTVANNIKMFTHRQVERAKEARRTYGMVGTPSP